RHGEHEERRGETSGPQRIRQMGEKAPQQSQHDGRLSLLPILTARKVGASRFPWGWQQVANRSRLASGSVERLASVQNGKAPGSIYRRGRSPHWVKVKNPDTPAVKREAEEDWGR